MISALLFQLFLVLVFPPALPMFSQEQTVVEERLPVVAGMITQAPPSIPAPALSARAALVWDAKTQEAIYEKNADEHHAIASVTKLMTVLVALEHGLAWDDVVTLTADDNDPEGSRLLLGTGSEVTVRDLFFATLIASANNATEALVRTTGIAEADYVGAMNAKAAALGMTATTFSDVTGLGFRNRSTARDLAKLADAVFAHPEVQDATTRSAADILDQRNGVRVHIENTNKLVGSDMRILAGKTGYTEAAGGVLIAKIRGNGERERTVIVLESAGREQRFADVRALADWVFAAPTEVGG